MSVADSPYTFMQVTAYPEAPASTLTELPRLRKETTPGPEAFAGTVKAFVDRAQAEALDAELAAAQADARGCPRPANYDGPFVLPKMRSRTWYQLARLLEYRALQEFGPVRPGPRPRRRVDVEQLSAEQRSAALFRQAFTRRPVMQMVKFVSQVADASGVISNTGRLIAAYRRCFGVDESTAYKHWRALRMLGLVRQTQHSAAGRHARYGGPSSTGEIFNGYTSDLRRLGGYGINSPVASG